MIVCFADVVNSTSLIEERGSEGLDDIEEILERLRDELKLYQIGPIQGDGMLMGIQDRSASDVLDTIIRWQERNQTGFLFRIAVCDVAAPRWLGDPWASGSTITGPELILLYRMKDYCGSGGVVIGEGLHAQLSGAKWLRKRSVPCSRVFKGWQGKTLFWAISGLPGSQPGDIDFPGILRGKIAEISAVGSIVRLKLFGLGGLAAIVLSTALILGWRTIEPTTLRAEIGAQTQAMELMTRQHEMLAQGLERAILRVLYVAAADPLEKSSIKRELERREILGPQAPQ